MDDTALSPLTLSWCPGCDTYAAPHTIVTDEFIDSQLGKPLFAGSPYPPMCIHCWDALFQAGKAGPFEAARRYCNDLLARIRTNTLRRHGGRELLS